MKKNISLLLFCIYILVSCKTYEDTVKIQDYVNLENYYKNLKDKSQKDLNDIASKMRVKSLTFKNNARLNKLLNNNLKSKQSSKRLWKQDKAQKNNFLRLNNNFEIYLTQDFFKLIDNAKSFEEIELFLEVKKKLVLNSEQLTIKEKKRLLRAIASVDLGLDFILNNVDLLDFTHYNPKTKRRYNNMTIQRCFRNGGRAFAYRCPTRLRNIGRVNRTQVCCRNISHSQATPYLPIIWGGALTEPTPVGEVIATVVTAGISLYYLNLAKNRPHCIALYVKRCKSPLPCSTCLQFCLTQGVWDFNNCPIK